MSLTLEIAESYLNSASDVKAEVKQLIEEGENKVLAHRKYNNEYIARRNDFVGAYNCLANQPDLANSDLVKKRFESAREELDKFEKFITTYLHGSSPVLQVSLDDIARSNLPDRTSLRSSCAPVQSHRIRLVATRNLAWPRPKVWPAAGITNSVRRCRWLYLRSVNEPTDEPSS